MILILVLSLCGTAFSAEGTGTDNRGFRPLDSSTFTDLGPKVYNVRYADGTLMRIRPAVEDVFLGHCAARTRLGIIRDDHKLPVFLDLVDGILGFAFANQEASASLFVTLTQMTRPSWGINQSLVPCQAGPVYCPQSGGAAQPSMAGGQMQHRSFSFFGLRSPSGVGEGFLHLGGYSKSALEGPLEYFPMLMQSGYGIAITSIKYKGQELLQFSNRSSYRYLVGEFDTGSRCLQIPDGIFVQGLGEDTYRTDPYSEFKGLNQSSHALNHSESHSSGLVFEFGEGNKFEIPIDDVQSGRSCVEGFKSDDIVLLGAPFYRHFLVFHDLDDRFQPRIGIGRLRRKSNTWGADRHTSTGDQENVVIARELSDGRYSIPLTVGTPPQEVNVLFDTGSSLLAVLTGPSVASKTKSSVATHKQLAIAISPDMENSGMSRYASVTGYIAAALWFAACGAVVLLWYKRRQQRARADGTYSRIYDPDYSDPIL